MTVTNSFMIDLSTLLAVIAVVIIPGIIAWISIREKVVRLEERIKMHESNSSKVDQRLDNILGEIKELREDLHQVRTAKKN